MSGPDFPVDKFQLHCPPLEDVAQVLQEGLKQNFENVKVSVVDCPDLTKKPYNLAAAGLGGSPRLADVGGIPYLIPVPKLDRVYNLEKLSQLSGVSEGLVIGAGAGSSHKEGVNCELMANMTVSSSGKEVHNKSTVAKVNSESGSYNLLKPNSTDFAILGNFFICEGKPGKVLEVKASRRTGSLNFMTCLRKTLENHYGTNPVALGGTFLIATGKANIHIMPKFSETPITSVEEGTKWLKFYEMSAPLVCVGEVVSFDPGFDLQPEHFHCYSEHGDGGHYHNDTTPSEVDYQGYFNLAECVFRVDPPKKTHKIGRE